MSDAPIIADCHTHTRFSDGSATFEENVRAAARAGCKVMVSTDHLTLPASMDPTCAASVAEDDLDAHWMAFLGARDLAEELGVELVYGFECDWYEGCEPMVEQWSRRAKVRLGSVHWLGETGEIGAGAARPGDPQGPQARVRSARDYGTPAGWIDDADNTAIWTEVGVDEIWRRYVDSWCRACESPLDFDIMAHPDLAMRFAREGFAPTIDLAPLLDRMAECARDTGRRVEISTAALRKGIGDYYPCRPLLERFCRAGVPIATGSDAHRAVDVAWGIREAQRHAFEVGYRSFDAPHADGDWETVPLG